MIDFDAIWRFQDEVRTVVNACLGDCIWDLNYNPVRQCIEMELERHLDDEELALLSSQLTPRRLRWRGNQRFHVHDLSLVKT